MRNENIFDDVEKSIKSLELLMLYAVLVCAESIYKSLGSFIAAVDRIYLNKMTEGQAPVQDFLAWDVGARNESNKSVC